MLQATCIGYLGADAQVKADNGQQFITMRIAHSERYTDRNGQEHDTTIWVDATMNANPVPKVFEYLKKGTLVFISGAVRLRVYSSEKDRCMKAGMTIHVRTIELLGGQSDVVPRRLYDKDGLQHDVTKFYYTDVKSTTLYSQSATPFAVDDKGWVIPNPTTPADDQPADNTAPSDNQTNVNHAADDAPTF